MSLTKSNRPAEKTKSPPDKNAPEKRKNWQPTNIQNSQELDRNEERTSPSGYTKQQQHSGQWNQNSGEKREQWNKDSTDEERDEIRRNAAGNSEQTGQQYSVEDKSLQELDQKNQKYPHMQSKDQHVRSHKTTQQTEYSEKERIQNSRGMNAPGMKNDQEMNQNAERKNISKKRDRKTDQIDIEE